MSILIKNQDMLKEGEKYLLEIRHDGTVYDAIGQRVAAQAVQFESPWHRVEEPPKEEGKYLVYDGRGNYYVAWWGPRLGWCYDPKFFCYWMPIEPPQEEQWK